MRNVGNHVVTVRLDVRPGQTTGDAAIDRIAELEAVLRSVREYLEWIGEYPEPRETIEAIDAVLAKSTHN